MDAMMLDRAAATEAIHQDPDGPIAHLATSGAQDLLRAFGKALEKGEGALEAITLPRPETGIEEISVEMFQAFLIEHLGEAGAPQIIYLDDLN